MKYTLYLINKNPVFNTIVTFTDAKDVIDFKKKAIQQGFQVKVKGERHDERRANRV